MLIITKGRIGALCRIVRETEKRYYVEIVSTGGFPDYLSSGVSGTYSTQPYVDKQDVWKTSVTEDQYDRYITALKQRDDTIKAATVSAHERYKIAISGIF